MSVGTEKALYVQCAQRMRVCQRGRDGERGSQREEGRKGVASSVRSRVASNVVKSGPTAGREGVRDPDRAQGVKVEERSGSREAKVQYW